MNSIIGKVPSLSNLPGINSCPPASVSYPQSIFWVAKDHVCLASHLHLVGVLAYKYVSNAGRQDGVHTKNTQPM